MTIESKSFIQLTVDQLYRILQLRCQVFMLEQNIICQDMDGVDRNSIHVFLQDGDEIIGCLRVFESQGTVYIGRVLIAEPYRGQNLGASLMDAGVQAAHKAFPGLPIHLHSQEQVVGFYEKQGFCVCSDRFLEEGVPHFEMKYSRN